MPVGQRSLSPTKPGATNDQRSPTIVVGLALALGGTLIATLIANAFGSISVLVAAVVVGAMIGNSPLSNATTEPGLRFAARRLLRIGVVMLGLRLSFGDVATLGLSGALVVAVTVVSTFVGTLWINRRLGLPNDLGLVVATGYSICGASAIAAVESSTDASEEEVAAAVGLVTLFGSMAIITLPAIADQIGLDDAQFAAWAGASVHDVAQVVATTSPAGTSVVAGAMLVKLTRVTLLAPLVTGMNLRRRRMTSGKPKVNFEAPPPPILPLFVAGFLTMVALRTSGIIPTGTLDLVGLGERWTLAIALVGLGSGVRFAALRKLGPKPLLLGALAWVLVSVVSLIGILTTG